MSGKAKKKAHQVRHTEDRSASEELDPVSPPGISDVKVRDTLKKCVIPDAAQHGS